MRRPKKHLTEMVARETAQPRVVVRDIMDALMKTIAQELAQGNMVTWTGLGTWEVRKRRSLLPGTKPFEGTRASWGQTPWIVFRPGRALRRSLHSQRETSDR